MAEDGVRSLIRSNMLCRRTLQRPAGTRFLSVDASLGEDSVTGILLSGDVPLDVQPKSFLLEQD